MQPKALQPNSWDEYPELQDEYQYAEHPVHPVSYWCAIQYPPCTGVRYKARMAASDNSKPRMTAALWLPLKKREGSVVVWLVVVFFSPRKRKRNGD